MVLDGLLPSFSRIGLMPREAKRYCWPVTTNSLPTALPKNGGTVRYRWREDLFALRNTDEGVWSLRDGDSATLGILALQADGTYRFTGNEHYGMPNIDAENWPVVLAFASVQLLVE